MMWPERRYDMSKILTAALAAALLCAAPQAFAGEQGKTAVQSPTSTIEETDDYVHIHVGAADKSIVPKGGESQPYVLPSDGCGYDGCYDDDPRWREREHHRDRHYGN